jgi:hypothetical protein
MAFSDLLSHPATRGFDIDDPRTTILRRRIIAEKKFLRRIYDEWYQAIAADVPRSPEPALEIGSGAGFLRDYIPGLITSELFPCVGVDLATDAKQLPLTDGCLRAVVMTDVLHHLPDVRGFFSEAARCVRIGGVIGMIEPWVTAWSRVVYGHFHHEPFEIHAANWTIPEAGPLSGANGALPWILFARDYAQFQAEFPEWRLKSLKPMMPFRYLLSGGVSRRSLMPGWSYGCWRAAETLLEPWMRTWAMFARIVLERVGAQAGGNRTR